MVDISKDRNWNFCARSVVDINNTKAEFVCILLGKRIDEREGNLGVMCAPFPWNGRWKQKRGDLG